MAEDLKFLPPDKAYQQFDKDLAKHEREQQKEAHEHQREIKYTEYQHEIDLKSLENKQQIKLTNKRIGWIGVIFGDECHASRNITACICISLIILCIVVYIWGNEGKIELIKEVFVPIITLSLGYLFGKSSNANSSNVNSSNANSSNANSSNANSSKT